MPPTPQSTSLAFRAAAGVALWLAGCAVIHTGDPIPTGSVLRAARPSADAATLDVYWAELPEGAADSDLWQGIEEMRLPPELRQRLASNGLRAGVVGGALPDEFLAALAPSDPAEATEDSGGGVRSLEESGVRRRTVQLRPGRRIELQSGPPTTSAPVLISRGGELVGRTFDQVQPTYAVAIDPPDGPGVRLRIEPELRHGERRLRFVPDDSGAISRATMTRDAERFPELAIAVTLAPGETLVVTGAPGSEGRLGGHFHQSGADLSHRRAMLIRLAGVPADDAFDAE